ncbi:ABC transporter ATP-binding protein [Neorhizobium lilium]|uniref:Spermidine/putrescine import ATP-binding protein PotA n=1 Tax=Neorhizobium lilium TaxID=2503024 RepID=A0A444LM98_9HYPH|nr:ABC transporter ATP-binding protein [Neorhizobium lilium]RWX81433.1 ABC transporter ATP-binding protein [Neorhizobium lilium]
MNSVSMLNDVAGAGVAVESIRKSYGTVVTAVDDVSLKVKPGEFVSILGPSGSGKTTLLMMIAGFERPTSGRLIIGDQDMTYTRPEKRGLGMVFQRYALFPHMSVADNIAYPLKRRGVSRAEIRQRVEAALKLISLDGLGTRMPTALSGGQQQRVAVARALVSQPPVMLMDEPLSALDKKLRDQMQLEIMRLHRTVGVTIIYVTHDQEEALSLSDRIVVMNRGRIEQVGTPDELYDEPASAFVADFIGRTSFLAATCLAVEGSNARMRVNDATEVIVPVSRCRDIVVGARVRIAVRPEALKLAVVGSAQLSGTLEGSRFVGSSELAFVRIANGELLQVQTEPGVSRKLQAGSPVGIMFDASRVSVFREGA